MGATHDLQGNNGMSRNTDVAGGKISGWTARITRTARPGRGLLAALLATGIASTSMMAFAHPPGGSDAHHGAGTHASYEQLNVAHLQEIVQHLMNEASPEQKQKMIAIANSAEPELLAMDKLANAARLQKIDLLLQDNVDRVALEQARVDELQAANELATRIDRVLVELAQAMTPEQRAKLKAHVHS
jgi:Spy/CpxP family protein refolding chaperone